MKILKIIFILIVISITQVLFDSCCDINTTYNITNFYINNIDNSGPTPIVTTNDTISENAYGIRVSLSTTYTQNTCVQPFVFVSNSYALACKQDYLLSNKIELFKIFTLNDYDLQHPAGSEVTDLFNGLSNEYGPFININYKINELNSSLSSLPEYFDIFLITPPTEGQIHVFRVEMQLYSSLSQTLSTNYITLF